jgi:hypothetical protein
MTANVGTPPQPKRRTAGRLGPNCGASPGRMVLAGAEQTPSVISTDDRDKRDDPVPDMAMVTGLQVLRLRGDGANFPLTRIVSTGASWIIHEVGTHSPMGGSFIGMATSGLRPVSRLRQIQGFGRASERDPQ